MKTIRLIFMLMGGLRFTGKCSGLIGLNYSPAAHRDAAVQMRRSGGARQNCYLFMYIKVCEIKK